MRLCFLLIIFTTCIPATHGATDDLTSKYERVGKAIECEGTAITVDSEICILYNIYNNSSKSVRIPVNLIQASDWFSAFFHDGKEIPNATGFPLTDTAMDQFAIDLHPKQRILVVGPLPTSLVVVGKAADGKYTFRHLVFRNVSIEFELTNKILKVLKKKS
jgi:hypothetical protein